MREAPFYSKTYWIPPRGSVGGLLEKIVRFFHHRMNVSCQSIELGRFANAGTTGKESSREFQGPRMGGAAGAALKSKET